MPILSIQSSVVAGHVGNAAATLPLQRLGCEVWPIRTVEFSSHPAHGGHAGRRTDPGLIAELIHGLDAQGRLAQCEALLSGYLGAPETGPVVLDAVGRLKAARPDALYCCDPVMGDAGRVYVDPAIPEFFREKGIAAADIATPNAFEAELLTGIRVHDLSSAREAAERIAAVGPALVLVTGILHGPDVQVLALEGSDAWAVTAPLVDAPAWGAGDLFTALFLGQWLKTRNLPFALSHATAAVVAVLKSTRSLGLADLALVAAQDILANPPALPTPQRLG